MSDPAAIVGRCRMNPMIDCMEQRCSLCGWNPEVRAKRVAAWIRREQQKRFQDACIRKEESHV